MSDPKSTHEEGPHEGPIKTPKQLVLAVFFATVVPIVVIIMLATFVTSGSRPAAGSDAMSAESVAARLQPVGTVEVRDPTDTASLKTGEQVFAAQCSACHTAGVAGAPKIGDNAAWAPRLAQGFEALVNSALKGKGAMGPQGGGDFSDFEISRAVAHMANQSGGKFEEPKAPGAGTSTAAAAPAPAAAAVPALYTQSCAVCHGAGIAGAPKLGDKAAWAPRIAAGMEAMVAAAIKGKGAMPPRGGSSASDAEIREVVTYMANAAK